MFVCLLLLLFSSSSRYTLLVLQFDGFEHHQRKWISSLEKAAASSNFDSLVSNDKPWNLWFAKQMLIGFQKVIPYTTTTKRFMFVHKQDKQRIQLMERQLVDHFKAQFLMETKTRLSALCSALCPTMVDG